METAALIKSYIYVVSSSLFYPVLFLLAGLTFWAVICAGSLFSEWIRRRRLKAFAHKDPEDLFFDKHHTQYTSWAVGGYITALKKVLENRSGTTPFEVESLLQKTQSKLSRGLDGCRLVVRVGPGLGLIGTLIPMGTGLAALGQGDLATLSQDLVIAFTTTVVGLAVGLCGFLFLTVRSRWVDDDILAMEMATEMLASEPEKPVNAGDQSRAARGGVAA